MYSYVGICSQWIWYCKSPEDVEPECLGLIDELDANVKNIVIDQVVKLILGESNGQINPFAILCYFPRLTEKLLNVDPDFPQRSISVEHVTHRILLDDEIKIFAKYMNQSNRIRPIEIIQNHAQKVHQCVRTVSRLRLERDSNRAAPLPMCLEDPLHINACDQTAYATARFLKMMNLSGTNIIDVNLDFSFSVNLLRYLQLSLPKFKCNENLINLIDQMNTVTLAALNRLSNKLPSRITKENADQVAKLIALLWETSRWFQNSADGYATPINVNFRQQVENTENAIDTFVQKFIHKRLFKESCIYYFSELMRRKFHLI